MKKKWDYGESWEKFPIKEGEIWTAGSNRLLCSDLKKVDDALLGELLQGKRIDMIYTDPPWNDAILKSFWSKSGMGAGGSFVETIAKILDLVKRISPRVLYIEMGDETTPKVCEMVKQMLGLSTEVFNLTYDGGSMKLIRAAFDLSKSPVDYSKQDDVETPEKAMALEKATSVLDCCMGLGLTARAAFKNKIPCYGIELQKRKLAKLLEWYASKKLDVSDSKPSKKGKSETQPKKKVSGETHGLTALAVIKRMALSDLLPHPQNPRVHPVPDTPEWDSLKASLEYDYFDPLVWNKRNKMLVSGHLRKKILESLGFTHADVSVVDYSEEEHLARLIQANHQQGDNDMVPMRDLLVEIKEDPDSLKLTGMPEREVDVLLAAYTEKETEQLTHYEDTKAVGGKTILLLVFGNEEKIEHFRTILASLKQKHETDSASVALLKELSDPKSSADMISFSALWNPPSTWSRLQRTKSATSVAWALLSKGEIWNPWEMRASFL